MSIVPTPLFFNPVAGRGQAARNILHVTELLNSFGIKHALVRSESVGYLETKVFKEF